MLVVTELDDDPSASFDVGLASDAYDDAHRAAQAELDPVKRATLFIKMNDLVSGDGYVIPVVFRPRVSAAVNKLSAPLSGWDNDMWALPSWFKES